MSKPIFEPRVERELARLGFASDQLLDRPAAAPSSSGFCPDMPWAYLLQTSDNTQSNGTQGAAFFSPNAVFDNSDPAVVEVEEFTGVYGFRFHQAGIYEISFAVLFTTVFSGEIQIRFHSIGTSVSGILGERALAFPFGVDSTELDSFTNEEFRYCSTTGHITILDLPEDPDYIAMQMSIFNNSGASRVIDYREATCHQIVEFVGS